MRRAALLASGLAVALVASGCESTQHKSARLERQAAKVKNATGLKVTKRSRDVRVGRTAVLSDANGSAAVVELRNSSRRALAGVPVAISIVDRRRRLLYANDAPGLDTSLVRAPVVRAHGRLLWVNDQVTNATGRARVRARVGANAEQAPSSLPKIAIRDAKLTTDVSGAAAVGRVVNTSRVQQVRLVVFGVVRRGGRIVAAGRAIVPKLAPGKDAKFDLFFIGNPGGGKLSLAAPPSVIR